MRLTELKKTKGKDVETESAGQDIESLIEWAFSGDALKDALLKGIKAKKVKVSFDEIDPDADRWDRTVYLEFSNSIPWTYVVHNFISVAHADEITVETGNKLRLWWD